MRGEPNPVVVFPPFEEFRKIPRLKRDVIVTEKIDGMSTVIYVHETDGQIYAGSRTKWLTTGDDKNGFAKWVRAHEDELRVGLGFGRHNGEWWGPGIGQRFKGWDGTKTFSLFNTGRWKARRVLNPGEALPPETAAFAPTCCDVVPVLYRGPFDTAVIAQVLERLRANGSVAAPGLKNPEGIIVYHVAGDAYFKQTIERDGEPKGAVEEG